MLLAGFFAASFGLLGQTPAATIIVTPDEATQHLTNRVEPVYPRIAQLANVQGVVRVMATIDEAGVVTKAVVTTSSPLLDQSPLDAVRQWRFIPFLSNGQAVRVMTELEFLFPNADSIQARLMDRYRSSTLRCRSLLSLGRPVDAIAPCDDAVAAAGEMPGHARLERMVAYERGGDARLHGGRAASAVPYFTSELAIRERIQASDATAWWNLARAYAAVPDLRETKRAYEKVESSLKRSRSLEIDSTRKNEAAKRLQVLLTELVEWLNTTGQVKDALNAQKRLADVTKSIR